MAGALPRLNGITQNWLSPPGVQNANFLHADSVLLCRAACSSYSTTGCHLSSSLGLLGMKWRVGGFNDALGSCPLQPRPGVSGGWEDAGEGVFHYDVMLDKFPQPGDFPLVVKMSRSRWVSWSFSLESSGASASLTRACISCSSVPLALGMSFCLSAPSFKSWYFFLGWHLLLWGSEVPLVQACQIKVLLANTGCCPVVHANDSMS